MAIDLTLSQLCVVVEVAEHGSFSRAAQARHAAQSSVSRTVAEVERAVGVRLFERTTRQVRLSVEGEAFVHLAREVLETYDRSMATFARHLEGTTGTVVIATLPSLAATLLPQLLHRFGAQRPDVQAEVRDVVAGEVVETIAAGRADLALTATAAHGGAPRQVEGLPFEALAVDTFRLVCARSHPFAERSEVHVRELATEGLISFGDDSSVRAIFEEALRSQDVRPRRRVSARNVATVGGMCSAGLGVTAVPDLVLPLMDFADLAVVPLAPETLRYVGVVSAPRRRRSQAAEALLAELVAMAGEGQPLPHGARWL